MVEVAGIEPASFVVHTGILRVQPAVIFSAPAVTQASCRRAQSLFGVPAGPVTGPLGLASYRRQTPDRKQLRADGSQLRLGSESEISALCIGTYCFPRNG